MSRQPQWLPTTKLRQCHLCCNSLVMSLRRVTAIDHASNPRWTASGCHALTKQVLKQYSVQEHELGFKICLSLKAASISDQSLSESSLHSRSCLACAVS